MSHGPEEMAHAGQGSVSLLCPRTDLVQSGSLCQTENLGEGRDSPRGYWRRASFPGRGIAQHSRLLLASEVGPMWRGLVGVGGQGRTRGIAGHSSRDPSRWAGHRHCLYGP